MRYDAHEIYPGLWQGGWPQPGRWLANQGVSTLVLCAMEYQPPHVVPPFLEGLPGLRQANPWPGVRVVYAPNDDRSDQPPSRKTLHQAIHAGRIVAADLAAGRTVLSTCWQGWNRSGLVSALGLHLHLGCSGMEAVDIVQKGRKRALCNPLFVEMLYNLRPTRRTV